MSGRISGNTTFGAWGARAALVFLGLCAVAAPVSSEPTVSNVRASQRTDGTHYVDVYYDLSGGESPMTVSVVFSNDSGASWEVEPSASSLWGDVGRDQSNGTGKHIVWDVATDRPGVYWTQAGVKVTALESHVGMMEMLYVPAGTFSMGLRDGESGDPDEVPRHEVTLSAYTIGKYEVTNQQYAEVLNWAEDQGYLTGSEGEPYVDGIVYGAGQMLLKVSFQTCQIQRLENAFEPKSADGFSRADHPVAEVSWYGAVAFCNWLSEMEDLPSAYDLTSWTLVDADAEDEGIQFNSGYRLPTEAEWERAAGWDPSESRQWLYGFGADTISLSRCNYMNNNPFLFSGTPYTTPAGWFDGLNVSPKGSAQTVDSPSPVGCYDMSGNIWEWCQDWYGAYPSSTQTDPLGPSSGLYRVYRGGDWNLDAYYSRVANRGGDEPALATHNWGFRVARSE